MKNTTTFEINKNNEAIEQRMFALLDNKFSDEIYLNTKSANKDDIGIIISFQKNVLLFALMPFFENVRINIKQIT